MKESKSGAEINIILIILLHPVVLDARNSVGISWVNKEVMVELLKKGQGRLDIPMIFLLQSKWR